MPHYLLGIYQPDTEEVPDNLDEIMRDLAALNDEIQAAGAWVFAAGLHAPSASTVVRAKGSETLITDGPYIEAKEHIGGFTARSYLRGRIPGGDTYSGAAPTCLRRNASSGVSTACGSSTNGQCPRPSRMWISASGKKVRCCAAKRTGM